MYRQKYFIASVYDTETTNIKIDTKNGISARAFPILFIDNEIIDVDLYNYKPEVDDNVFFYRTEAEMINKIRMYVNIGKIRKEVPIICAYNLMFDLQPLMFLLKQEYDMRANAQSSTNVYTLDLYEKDSDTILLRFWDTFHLEMRGLSAMGQTAGLPKAIGDWDYSLIRTAKTELTEEEYYYAKRDVQVIPAYLKYLLHANEWMKQSDFGVRVLTKTSIVRQMARKQISNLSIIKTDGEKITVDKMFSRLCQAELPKTYGQYALRKACFRGGFTFTAAKYASTVQRNVVSADVTSMHHTFINGRMVPNEFKILKAENLVKYVKSILDTPKDSVLSRYDKPFDVGIHVRLVFRNIRLKKGSAFEEYGIGLIPLAKFKPEHKVEASSISSESNDAAENMIRIQGWHDTFVNAIFAFGKLYQAEKITIHVNEIELWAISRVYEWDKIEVVCGEGTMSFIKPPDYVTLQSNILFEAKSAAKFIASHYHKGEPYPFPISDVIPDGIKQTLLDGTCEEQFFEEYYTNTVKGMFNGIYGTMAQDVYKPDFLVDSKGQIEVDHSTLVTDENWEEMQPDKCRVLYTYGMRIVAGSRLHMILAIEEIYDTFGEKVKVLGGDTDSMKMSCDYSITDKDLEDCLKIFEIISKKAIDSCMVRIRTNFKDKASLLLHIGGFEIENKNHHYDYHVELWNKARISYGENRAHITCAGLSRPIGKFHIERYIENLISAGNKIEDVLLTCVGYNVYVAKELSYSMMGHRPKTIDTYNDFVTDYLGNTTFVDTYESIALYEDGRWLGETSKFTNIINIRYLKYKYDRDIDTRNKYLKIDDNMPVIYVDGEFGFTTYMFGESIC